MPIQTRTVSLLLLLLLSWTMHCIYIVNVLFVSLVLQIRACVGVCTYCCRLFCFFSCRYASGLVGDGRNWPKTAPIRSIASTREGRTENGGRTEDAAAEENIASTREGHMCGRVASFGTGNVGWEYGERPNSLGLFVAARSIETVGSIPVELVVMLWAGKR